MASRAAANRTGNSAQGSSTGASNGTVTMRCSIADAHKTIHKFEPGAVNRAEAACSYITWAGKMKSWL